MDAAAAYGSHADPASFEHRLKKGADGAWRFHFHQLLDTLEERSSFSKLLRNMLDALEMHLLVTPETAHRKSSHSR